MYDADETGMDALLQRFRISSNAIYPFRSLSTGKLCVLRLSPVEEKDIQEVSSEIRMIEWLIEQGFPAMKPYPMKDGQLYTVMQTSWGNYNMSCFEVVSGETLEDCDGSPELIRGYGRTLGRMHSLLKEYPFSETRRNYATLMEEIQERFDQYNAPAELKSEWTSVNAELKTLNADKDCYGIIHYDFEADNILYDEETDAFGVIDFDDAIRCWYALDLARAIDSLEDVAENVEPAQAKAEFLAGYREAASFSEEQQATIPLMRRLVRLQEYATILHVLSEPGDSEPDWMTFIIGKLKRIEKELAPTDRNKDN